MTPADFTAISSVVPDRRRRIVEMALLFFALPIGLAVFRSYLKFMVIPLILVSGLVFGVLLLRDRTFDRRAFFATAGFGRHVRAILLLFVPLAALLGTAAWLADSRYLFMFPRRWPTLWVIFMIGYPTILATLQEIFFRGYFFHRYGRLFVDPRALILVNAVAFALYHVFFGNAVAPALSFLGGLLFAWRYQKTGSLFAVAFEHGLWGDFLFTVGIGRFLFSGTIH